MNSDNGAINFKVGLDNSQLQQDAERAKAALKDIGNSAKVEGSGMDNAFKTASAGITRSIKDAIQSQKQLIKEIEKDIDQLQKKLNSPEAFGTKRNNILGDLSSAKKALAEEQGALLGLQKQQIDGNTREAESQGGIIAGLGKWLIGLFAVSKAIDFFKNVLESTDRTSVAFHSAIEGAKTGLDYFMRSIATGDFSNFLDGMRKAISAGSEFTKKMDYINNLKREYSLKEVDLNKKIEEQRLIFYGNDKTSLADKIAAGEKMKGYMKDKSDNEVDAALKTYNTVADLEKSKNKLSAEDARYGIENYKQVEEIGKAYSEAKNALDNYNNSLTITKLGVTFDASNKNFLIEQNAPRVAALKATIKEMDDEAKKYGEKDAARYGIIYEGLENTSEKGKQVITDSLKSVGIAQNSYLIESKRVYRMTENMEDQEASKTAAAAKKANELAQKKIDYTTEEGRLLIENDLKIQQERLNLQKDGAEKERAQAELDYQKTLVDIAKQSADKLKKYNEVTGGTTNVNGKIVQTAKYSSVLPTEDLAQSNEFIILAEQTKNKKIEDINKKAADKLKKLWEQINDARLTGLEKARAAMNEKYDKMVVDAGTNSEALKTIEVERGKAEQDLVAKFSFKDFQKAIDWAAVFGDLDAVSTSALNNLRDKLKTYLAGVGDSISQEDMKAVAEAFKKLNVAIADRTPIKELVVGYKDFKASCDAVAEAQQKLNDLTDSGNGSTEDLATANKNLTEAQSNRAASLAKMNISVNSFGKEGQKLIGAAQDVTDMLADLGVNVGAGVSTTISGFGKMFDGLASINFTNPISIIKGGIKVVSGLVDVVSGIFGAGAHNLSQSVIDYYDDLMSTMKDVISVHKALIAEFSGQEAVSESEKTIELINKQIEATRTLGLAYFASNSARSHSKGYQTQAALDPYKSQLADIGVDFADSKGGIGQLFTMTPAQLTQIKEQVPAAWAAIGDQTRAYLQTIIDSGTELEDTTKALGEALTDLSFDSAKDSLKNLLLSADTTMADIANNFEDYMRNAIVNALIDGQLAPLMKQWYVDFTKAMEDGVLSPEEKAALNKEYSDIGQTGIASRDAAYAAAGISLTPAANNNSMKGKVSAALTEDTANEFVGLQNRMSIDMRGILEASKASVNYNFQTAANTLRTADNTDRLSAMEISLKSIDTAVNKTASRI